VNSAYLLVSVNWKEFLDYIREYGAVAFGVGEDGLRQALIVCSYVINIHFQGHGFSVCQTYLFHAGNENQLLILLELQCYKETT